MSFGDVLGGASSVMGIASGAQSLFGDSIDPEDLQKTIYDPFREYRQGYATRLGQLYTDPNNYMKQVPGFESSMKYGEEALRRNLAARGMRGSGNEMAALFDFGRSNMLDFRNKEISTLAMLAGATTSPISNAGGYNAISGQQSGGWQAIAQGLGGLSQNTGLASVFGSTAAA